MRFLIPLLVVGLATSVQAREWTYADGQTTLEAEYDRTELRGKVYFVILKKAGAEIPLPVTLLSREDRAYIQEMANKPAEPLTEMRYWTNESDGVMKLGELIRINGETVRLRDKNGKEGDVPRDLLSPADQSLISAIERGEEPPTTDPPPRLDPKPDPNNTGSGNGGLDLPEGMQRGDRTLDENPDDNSKPIGGDVTIVDLPPGQEPFEREDDPNPNSTGNTTTGNEVASIPPNGSRPRFTTRPRFGSGAGVSRPAGNGSTNTPLVTSTPSRSPSVRSATSSSGGGQRTSVSLQPNTGGTNWTMILIFGSVLMGAAAFVISRQGRKSRFDDDDDFDF